ncbi:hypothetical protein L596_030616 [Steinernema carpocapsae]|uniref:AD domain-containing protein n=1 Tax=Steinernema carpocapsae TaxID=34508 RepID=A0A4U5LPX2_STECR|nr:hypothetical protein L596_030616 [Steinernema carpocapsae]
MVGVMDGPNGPFRHTSAQLYDEPGSVNEMVFPTGSVVEGTTALGQKIKGEVLGFDQQRKLLIIRDNETGSKSVMRFLNLEMINENFKITENRSPDFVPLGHGRSSAEQLDERIRKAVDKRDSSALQCEVPIEGQRAFIALRKTLDQVEWNMDKIDVFDGKISVEPPYNQEGVKLLHEANPNNLRAVEQIKLILGKPHVPTPLSSLLKLKSDAVDSSAASADHPEN